ncbi:hypothetical protein CH380_13340 [Leptospira adleri]|uniref:Uncharacterized protein n=1 Tax=Leptospira adleri TaxID=2023186 RepID=A0A2M9YMJ1_9LEPT|nr:hypothetical protein CH380_13340 [Leptospira adleri]PJZ61754.1 hypothetical protein CH376_11620 [Leptospira adleri]
MLRLFKRIFKIKNSERIVCKKENLIRKNKDRRDLDRKILQMEFLGRDYKSFCALRRLNRDSDFDLDLFGFSDRRFLDSLFLTFFQKNKTEYTREHSIRETSSTELESSKI